jgi:hypothetical protein
MSGWHQYADRYPISSWLLGCMEKEISDHVEIERNRILQVLKPHAEHKEWCKDGGCYPEDCSAPLVQWLIRKILETDLQENVNNDGQKEGQCQE